MLYKHPGIHEIHGNKFNYIVVDDDQIEDTIADGWHLTTTDALGEEAADDEALTSDIIQSMTRDELKALAVKINLDGYYSRMSTEDLIEELNKASKV
tara:strand:+ start:1425 stop:1715 length:291 start_codon:yes stop_codon:yes gene_type:complete